MAVGVTAVVEKRKEAQGRLSLGFRVMIHRDVQRLFLKAVEVAFAAQEELFSGKGG